MQDSTKGTRLHRTDQQWFELITECRQSGMSDYQWCKYNNVSTTSFYTAVKRLRSKAIALPERDDDIYDLTASRPDIVQVDIVRDDIKPPAEVISEVAQRFDNSHM